MEKELRLGNLVYGVGNKPFKVAKISTPQFENWNSGEDCNIIIEDLEKKDYYMEHSGKGISPIPLTEDWLLKLGFYLTEYRKTDNNIYYCNHYLFNKNNYSILVKESGFVTFNFNGSFLKELKYVHQLQNLFFALTETELTINQ